jgi:hypothetical protein
MAESTVVPRLAFIVRQLKRPDEARLLSQIYGKRFILVSAYGSEADRRSRLVREIKASLPLSTSSHDISSLADRLIARDFDEKSNDLGQHLSDTYHLADVFVDGINREKMRLGVSRFIRLFSVAPI